MTEARAVVAGVESISAPASLEDVLPGLMPDLLRYFVRRLADREDAADALAETLLVLWRKEPRLPGDREGIRRYAFGVAAKVLSTAIRGRLRRAALADRLRDDLARSIATGGPVGVARDPAPVTGSPAPLTGEPVEIAEGTDLDLRRALAGLVPRDRELVLLVAWDGFGIAEAGAVLGLRPAAARQRWSRARARLREQLAD